MRVINFSYAKSQLNQVVDDADFTIIVRRYAPSAVVMSLDTLNSLMETLQLMKSSANIKHLEKSIAQYRKDQIKNKDRLCTI
jgi:antitoxin YefM